MGSRFPLRRDNFEGDGLSQSIGTVCGELRKNS